MNEPSPLVSVGWLEQRIGDPRVVIADTRWYLSRDQKGIDAYNEGHIPGAAFVDVDTDLSSPPAPLGPGRHPLPSAKAFGELMGRLGIGPEDTVVAYDDAGGAYAARLFWLLRHFRHATGAVLDGGVQAWVKAGNALDTRPFRRASTPAPVLTARAGEVVDKTRIAALIASGSVVLDARARERYEGKVEPVDARPGHIPGAKSAPFTENLVAVGGPFRAAVELQDQYRKLGALDAPLVVAYCGSGVTACHDLFALELAGRRDGLVLYEGSWSDWAADASLPAALGPEP